MVDKDVLLLSNVHQQNCGGVDVIVLLYYWTPLFVPYLYRSFLSLSKSLKFRFQIGVVFWNSFQCFYRSRGKGVKMYLLLSWIQLSTNHQRFPTLSALPLTDDLLRPRRENPTTLQELNLSPLPTCGTGRRNVWGIRVRLVLSTCEIRSTKISPKYPLFSG